ncbi:hypothetical protein [Paraclostridium bifermentans]|uniref:hypothetical protein n=1 Tax=Paraclostridium bifermentans TaxID=1490 RepID=UPI00359C5E17
MTVMGIFLTYSILSGIYWIINKNIKNVCHYELIVLTYIGGSIILLIVVAYRG